MNWLIVNTCFYYLFGENVNCFSAIISRRTLRTHSFSKFSGLELKNCLFFLDQPHFDFAGPLLRPCIFEMLMRFLTPIQSQWLDKMVVLTAASGGHYLELEMTKVLKQSAVVRKIMTLNESVVKEVADSLLEFLSATTLSIKTNLNRHQMSLLNSKTCFTHIL